MPAGEAPRNTAPPARPAPRQGRTGSSTGTDLDPPRWPPRPASNARPGRARSALRGGLAAIEHQAGRWSGARLTSSSRPGLATENTGLVEGAAMSPERRTRSDNGTEMSRVAPVSCDSTRISPTSLSKPGLPPVIRRHRIAKPRARNPPGSFQVVRPRQGPAAGDPFRVISHPRSRPPPPQPGKRRNRGSEDGGK